MNSSMLENKIAKLKSGDMGAFDYVYEQTNRSVYFAILYIVRDKSTAEDVLQDTYVRAIGGISSYQSGTNFVGWLIRIGKNLALNHVKKAAREISIDFDAESYRFGSYETNLPFIFDLAAKVLSEDEYEILMLCNVAGYKRREVAQMLDIPLGTVTWKNSAALKKLREHIKKEDAHEG